MYENMRQCNGSGGKLQLTAQCPRNVLDAARRSTTMVLVAVHPWDHPARLLTAKIAEHRPSYARYGQRISYLLRCFLRLIFVKAIFRFANCSCSVTGAVTVVIKYVIAASTLSTP
jgi:hypothetical protein